MIRVLIADDHLLFRAMLEEMLKRDDELEVVAACEDGDMVLKELQIIEPDIALLDIGMPGKGGLEALKEIKKAFPKTKVVMLTTFEDEANIKIALQLGADGYLIKDMKPEILIMSLKCIYNDMMLFHKSVHKILQSAVLEPHGGREKKIKIDDMVFDAVDIRIMQLIVQGKSNRDIGNALNYSEGTIKNRISKLLSVTGFSDRTELSVFAIQHALI